MDIREITVNEIEEIKPIIRNCFEGEPWKEDWSDEKNLTQYVLDLIDNHNHLGFGLYQNGKLIGVCLGRFKHWPYGLEYEIDDFCIDPSEQGKGLGKKFLEGMQTELKERNVKLIYLLTERGIPACKFYESLGFRESTGKVSYRKEI